MRAVMARRVRLLLDPSGQLPLGAGQLVDEAGTGEGRGRVVGERAHQRCVALAEGAALGWCRRPARPCSSSSLMSGATTIDRMDALRTTWSVIQACGNVVSAG